MRRTDNALSLPCLCEACRDRVSHWLRQYERQLQVSARQRLSRHDYLSFALCKQVASVLRRLRRTLASAASPLASIAERAKDNLPDTQAVEEEEAAPCN